MDIAADMQLMLYGEPPPVEARHHRDPDEPEVSFFITIRHYHHGGSTRLTFSGPADQLGQFIDRMRDALTAATISAAAEQVSQPGQASPPAAVPAGA